MVSRLIAGAIAGVFALAASPAFAQTREVKRVDQSDEVKKLQAELERLKAVEAELQAKLRQLANEAERAKARGERNTAALELLEQARLREEVEAQRARVLEGAAKQREKLGRVAQEEV